MEPQDDPSERYEQIPWEHLAVGPSDDRRRWLTMAGAGLALVAVVAFLLGSRPPPAAPTPVPAAADTLPATTPEPPEPATTAVAPPPTSPPSEADLRAEATPTDLLGLVTAHVAELWDLDGEAVGVRPIGQGLFVATVALPTGEGLVADYAMEVGARLVDGALVVDHLHPVAAAEPAQVPEPVAEAVADAVAAWPGATVIDVGRDAHGWWATIGVGDGSRSVVIRPSLPSGLGSGG